MKFASFCEHASQLANLFGHPSQVRMQVLVLQTCINLRICLAKTLYLSSFTSKSDPWWVGLLGDFNENMAFAKYMADYKISVDNGLHLLGVIKLYDTHSLRGISKVYGLYPLSWEAIGVLRDQPSSRSISFQCLLLSTISSFYKFCFISTVTCAIRYTFPSACITILASTVFLSPTWVYSASTQHLLRVLYLTLYHLLIPIHLPGLHTVPHSRLFKTSQFALVFLFLANGIPQPHSETYQQ